MPPLCTLVIGCQRSRVHCPACLQLAAAATLGALTPRGTGVWQGDALRHQLKHQPDELLLQVQLKSCSTLDGSVGQTELPSIRLLSEAHLPPG